MTPRPHQAGCSGRVHSRSRDSSARPADFNSAIALEAHSGRWALRALCGFHDSGNGAAAAAAKAGARGTRGPFSLARKRSNLSASGLGKLATRLGGRRCRPHLHRQPIRRGRAQAQRVVPWALPRRGTGDFWKPSARKKPGRGAPARSFFRAGRMQAEACRPAGRIRARGRGHGQFSQRDREGRRPSPGDRRKLGGAAE